MEELQERKSSNTKIIIAGLILVIALIGIFTNWFWLVKDKKVNNLAIDNSPVLGNINASVTIYEFSDFSCPFCAAAEGYNQDAISVLKKKDSLWKAPIPEIKEKYINSGKVKLVFKYSPGHGTGMPAHIVAWCLKDQNMFWKFKEQAFQNAQDAGNLAKMKEIAVALGANAQELESCLQSGKYSSKFDDDTKMGIDNGVKGTPTFFINNKSIEGALSFSDFEKIIEEELKR